MSNSVRSLGSLSTGVSMNASLTPSIRMERDLLERMLLERDERITALQKTISIQKEHTLKLQHTLNDTRLIVKENQTKTKLDQDHITYERDVAQMQLHSLAKEREKYKDTVFKLNDNTQPPPPASIYSAIKHLTNGAVIGPDDHAHALAHADTGKKRAWKKPRSPSRSYTTTTTTQKQLINKQIPLDKSQNTRPPTPARTESAHALYLQSQLYQAMHSISALKIQTKSMKVNCDAVVKSLMEDLTETTTLKHQIEVELMSQLTLLEREKNVMQGLLEEKIRIREERLKKSEAKILALENLQGYDSSESEDGSENDQVMGISTMSLSTVKESMDTQTDGENDHEVLEPEVLEHEVVGHEQMESLLQELELMATDNIQSSRKPRKKKGMKIV